MNRAFVLAFLLVALAACKKAEPTPAIREAATIALDSSNGPVTMFPDAIIVPDTGDPNAALSQLSLELRRYVLRSKSVPASFENFVTLAHVQAPAPPTGKKYFISGGAVKLADQ